MEGFSREELDIYLTHQLKTAGVHQPSSGVTVRYIDHRMDAEVTTKEMRLRKVYRKLIDVAGLYYYVSLPFVAVLLLAIAGSVLYGFPAIGRIPVQLMVVLVLGTVGTIYKMARSVFIKVKPQDPPRARGSARTLETDGRGGK